LKPTFSRAGRRGPRRNPPPSFSRGTHEGCEVKLIDDQILRQAHAAEIDLNTLLHDATVAELDITEYLRRKGRTELREADLPEIIRTVPRALDSLRVRRTLSFVRSRHLTKRRRPEDTALLLAVFRALQKLQFTPGQFKAMQSHAKTRAREKAADVYLAERGKKTGHNVAAKRAMDRQPWAFKTAGALRTFACRRAKRLAAEVAAEEAARHEDEAVHARLLAQIAAEEKRLHPKAEN
jgi:hypothetical protein